MSFSLSTVLYASVWGGIFSLCLLALLNQKKAYALMRPGLLVAFLAVIVLRFLLPVEFFFTQTIPLTFFLPDLYTFLRADLLLEQSVLEWLVVFWIAGVAVIGWIKMCRYRRGARCLEQIRNRSEEETLSKDDRRNFAGQDLQIRAVAMDTVAIYGGAERSADLFAGPDVRGRGSGLDPSA